MKRLHLFEFHDLSWFPAIFRDALTEWLRVLWTQAGAYSVIAGILGKAFERTGAAVVIDLCSGGSGPLLGVQREFEANGREFHAIATDKYPNVDSMRGLEGESHGAIEGRLIPVDATAVPRELAGVRTLFNSFHHFGPELARSILADAYEARQPIAIFEIPNRQFAGVAFSFIATFLGVVVLTPTMRPRRPSWWLFTYLVPVIPFIVAWDGWVSHVRAYTPDELLGLANGFSRGYRWEVKTVPLKSGRFTLTSLIGLPGPERL